MKVINLISILIIFIQTLNAQKWDFIIPMSSKLSEVKIAKYDNSTIFLFKQQGVYYFLDETLSFPGIQLRDIDSAYIENNALIVRKKKYWGVYDRESNNYVIPAVYEKVRKITDSDYYFVSKYGATCIVDKNNKKLTPYFINASFNPDSKLVKTGENEYSYVVKEKESLRLITIPQQKTEIQENTIENFKVFDTILFIKYANFDGWQLFNNKSISNSIIKATGVPILKCNDKVIFKQKWETSLFKLDGQQLLPPEYSDIQPDNNCENFIIVRKKLYGLFNITKGILIEPKFRSIFKLKEVNDLYNIVDEQNNLLYSASKNKFIDSCHIMKKIGNYYFFQKNRLYGLIDEEGKYKFNAEWKSFKTISSDLAIVEKEDKQAIISSQAKFLTLFTNVKYDIFQNYFIRRTDKENQVTFFDLNMSELTSPEIGNLEVSISNNKLLIIKDARKLFGLTDKSLKPVIPRKYQNIKMLDDNHYILEKDGETGVIKITD